MDKLRVLFVDDDKRILSGIERMLKKLIPDLEAFFASSASDALLQMEAQTMDIIISDMCMAGMNGYDLLELVKQRYPATVRVMMTGKQDLDIYRDGMQISQYFLFKPVQLSAMQILFEMVTREEFVQNDEQDSEENQQDTLLGSV